MNVTIYLLHPQTTVTMFLLMTKAFPQTTVAMSLALHHGDWTIVWENTFVIATRNLNSRLEKYFYATRNLNSPLGKCFCYQIIARKLWQSSGEMLLPVHCNDIVTICLLQIWKHLLRLSQFPKAFPRWLSQFPDDCPRRLSQRICYKFISIFQCDDGVLLQWQIQSARPICSQLPS